MIRESCLAAALMLLIGSSMILTASSQEQVSQTVYVHEGDLNGTLLSGVQVTGQDAAGNSFEGVTDSNGVAVVIGQPGTWQFEFTKDGYETLDLSYDVTESGEGAVYQVKASQTQEQVSQTVYVHEGDYNGTVLSGVHVTGRDAAGNSFEGMTDSNGAVVVKGQPGTWQFVFTKDGYETLNLSHDVTEAVEGAVYLNKASQTQEQVSQTVYVHEGDLNGTLLSGVQVTGQDAAGNSFEGMTDSDGVVVVKGQPGTWQFVFTKDGYETLDLSYDVTETGVGAVYLVGSSQPDEQIAPMQNSQQIRAISESTGSYRTQLGTDETPLVEPKSSQEQEKLNITVSQEVATNKSETAYVGFWIEKGNSIYEQGRYNEAVQSYDRAIQLNPQLEAAWINKGNALYMQGNYDQALQAFDRVIEMDAQNAIAWNCRGLTLMKLDRTADANEAFAKAKELDIS